MLWSNEGIDEEYLLLPFSETNRLPRLTLFFYHLCAALLVTPQYITWIYEPNLHKIGPFKSIGHLYRFQF